jgi:UDP-N-acetylglucosamine:LPS N-acetylglucosamine transferase
LTGELLFKDIEGILSDEETLQHMQESAYIMGIRDSIERFNTLIEELTGKR